jgi:Tfp pilus assembly protein PilO
MKYNSKTKIYLALFLWVALSASMVFYFFKILQASNASAVNDIAKEQRELASLESERDSYQLAKKDIAEMKGKEHQPEDFFSKDVTLVNEIRALEALGQSLNIDLDLSGLSGTVKSSQAAKEQGSFVAVPYSIHVSGTYANVVAFIETMENLDFVTNLTSMLISGSSDGEVSASMTANFYLKRQ